MTEPAPPAGHEPPTEAQIAEKLFGPKPADAAPPALPKANVNNFFDPSVTFREDLRPGLETLRTLGDSERKFTDQQLDEHSSAMADAFQNAGFSSTVARDLHGLMVAALKSPISKEQSKAWGVEARELLDRKYGTEEADQRLARAQQFIKAHPYLQELLSFGPGSHPRVVLALAERAYALRVPRAKK